MGVQITGAAQPKLGCAVVNGVLGSIMFPAEARHLYIFHDCQRMWARLISPSSHTPTQSLNPPSDKRKRDDLLAHSVSSLWTEKLGWHSRGWRRAGAKPILPPSYSRLFVFVCSTCTVCSKTTLYIYIYEWHKADVQTLTATNSNVSKHFISRINIDVLKCSDSTHFNPNKEWNIFKLLHFTYMLLLHRVMNMVLAQQTQKS